jgi:xylulokinase
VAFAVCDAVGCVLAGVSSVDHLRLGGGGSTDPAWRQLLADILDRELRAVDVPVASGRGAALLGARAAGLTDERTMLARLPPVTDVVARPRRDRVSSYAERHQSFTRKVAALRRADRRVPANA